MSVIDETWQDLDSADKRPFPAPIKHVDLLLRDGSVIVGHYAFGDGEGLMPAFRGWFTAVLDREGKVQYYRQVEPVMWRPRERKAGE